MRNVIAPLRRDGVSEGMITSMTRQKIAITLPEEQVAAARRAVAEGLPAGIAADDRDVDVTRLWR